MKTGTSPRIFALLALLVAAVYGRTLKNGFVSFDDVGYVLGNPHVMAGLTWEGVRYAFGFTDASYWHPLPFLSHMADVSLFGLNPGLHHLASAFFHFVNACLFYLALLALTGKPGRSAAAAAIFAVHPVNVDSVAWIAERKNLLSTLFFLAAVLSYARYARKPSILRYLPVFLLMLLGLLSKPTVVTLPAALLLLDWWPLGRFKNGPPRAADGGSRPARLSLLLAEKIPLAALSAASAVLTIVSTRKAVFEASVSTGPPLLLRMENFVVSCARYLENAFWPRDLAFFHPYPSRVPAGQLAACAALLSIMLMVFYGLRKSRPYLIVGFLWFLAVLSPMSGIVQSGLWPAYADRFAYVPLLGIFTAVVWLAADFLQSFPRARKAPATLAALVILLLACAAFVQASCWKDSKTLYTHAITVTRNNFVAHTNLGIVLLDEGDVDGALAHCAAAFRMKPGFDELAVNLGNAWFRKGDLKRAAECYEKALEIRPGRVRTLLNLAAAENGLKNYPEMERAAAAALALAPSDPEVRYALGLALAAQGRFPEARFQLSEALRIAPSFTAAARTLASLPREAA